MQRHRVGLVSVLSHQFGRAVRHGVGRGEQDLVGSVHITGRGRMALVSDQRRYRQFGIAEISGEARERVPQNMRCDITRQLAELGNSGPQFRKAGHAAIATRCREYQFAGSTREIAQHVTHYMRQRTNAAAGLGVTQCRRAPGKVNL